MAIPTDFKKSLAAFAERNSQTKTYTGEVITAPDVDGKCKVRISGGTAQTCLAIGRINQGDQVPVMRFPGLVYPIAIGGDVVSSEATMQSGLPLTVTHDLITHALDGQFHTGTLRDDQAPQFSLIDALNQRTRHANDVDNLRGIHWTRGANDGRYLKLDASNDPVTGGLDIEVDDHYALRVLTKSTGPNEVAVEMWFATTRPDAVVWASIATPGAKPVFHRVEPPSGIAITGFGVAKNGSVCYLAGIIANVGSIFSLTNMAEIRVNPVTTPIWIAILTAGDTVGGNGWSKTIHSQATFNLRMFVNSFTTFFPSTLGDRTIGTYNGTTWVFGFDGGNNFGGPIISTLAQYVNRLGFIGATAFNCIQVGTVEQFILASAGGNLGGAYLWMSETDPALYLVYGEHDAPQRIAVERYEGLGHHTKVAVFSELVGDGRLCGEIRGAWQGSAVWTIDNVTGKLYTSPDGITWSQPSAYAVGTPGPQHDVVMNTRANGSGTYVWMTGACAHGSPILRFSSDNFATEPVDQTSNFWEDIQPNGDSTFTLIDMWLVYGDDIEVFNVDSISGGTTVQRLVVEAATGTIPLDIASTTRVPNLNVDRLDDFEAADLRRHEIQRHGRPLPDQPVLNFSQNFSMADGDGATEIDVIFPEPTPRVIVEEADGTPSVANVTTIRVGNGDLTDEGSGVVRLRTASDAAGSASGRYRQFVFVVADGDFSFVKTADGHPVTVLLPLE